MRFLIRLAPVDAARAALLASVKAVARTLGVEVRSPKWTSKGALEVDVFAPSQSDFDLFLAAVGPLSRLEFTRDLNAAPKHRAESELYSEARGLFNSERYWECHEVLEGVWREKSGAEKRLLQGIILVCAAFVHHQKDEEDVALGVLKRAEPLLAQDGPAFAGFDMDEMRRRARAIVQDGRFEEFQA